jgi:hypothetical protein
MRHEGAGISNSRNQAPIGAAQFRIHAADERAHRSPLIVSGMKNLVRGLLAVFPACTLENYTPRRLEKIRD